MSDEIRMTDLIEKLNNATLAYDEGHPIMSDEEWDSLYFILQTAEKMSGIYMPNSPTQQVIYEVKNELNKVEHNHKMLSLEKTKDINEVNDFLHNQPFIAMCKMDGLTCSLRYVNGKLVSAETRGDGLIGEDITHNAMVIPTIPKRIQITEEMVIDGEIICDFSSFEQFSSEYKNPRNFASGSIRLLDANECAHRNLTFVAWEVMKGLEDVGVLSQRFEVLDALGFTVVPFVKTDLTIADDGIVSMIKLSAAAHRYPIDGVVFKFNDIAYGHSLGETSHHFKNAIAFKFYDETAPTELVDIEWTMGRTGVLTPVAIVKPIDMDGSTIERASLHNISIMKETLGKRTWRGQKVEIFKANMIIPQIYSAEADDNSTKDYIEIPQICPVCGSAVQIVKSEGGTETLICINPNCDGKLINVLDHFCGKKGLDIKGLSAATLEKLIDWGWINSTYDIFNLKDHRVEWINKAGFGEKSVDNILNAIEQSKNPSLEAFISSIGIPLVGRTISKELVKHINSYEEFRNMVDEKYDFSQFDGFAESKTNAILNFDYSEADKIYQLMDIAASGIQEEQSQALSGKTFAITGKLTNFKNRAELVEKIESLGGKISSTVNKNTNYLINNDNESSSAKNLNARKLNIPVITEQDFLDLIDK